jgi:hypothetical protein
MTFIGGCGLSLIVFPKGVWPAITQTLVAKLAGNQLIKNITHNKRLTARIYMCMQLLESSATCAQLLDIVKGLYGREGMQLP